MKNLKICVLFGAFLLALISCGTDFSSEDSLVKKGSPCEIKDDSDKKSEKSCESEQTADFSSENLEESFYADKDLSEYEVFEEEIEEDLRWCFALNR